MPSLNSPFGPVEFVLIGQRGHGKSSLIEALSGHIVTHVQLALVPPPLSPRPSDTLVGRLMVCVRALGRSHQEACSLPVSEQHRHLARCQAH